MKNRFSHVLTVMIVALLILSLIGCGSNQNNASTAGENTSAAQAATTEAAATQEATAQETTTQAPATSVQGTQADETESSGDKAVDAAADVPVPVPEISILSVMGADYDENPGIILIQEKLGLKFEIITVPGETASEKFNIMVQSDTLPDMVFEIYSYCTPTEIYRLGQEGILMRLNDLLENAPNIQAQWNKYPDVRKAATTPDGSIYALPANLNDYGQDIYNHIFIEKRFLENLNMEMPTTIDEFYNFLRAVKDEDANGNGDPNDEIPFISAEIENRSGSGSAWNLTRSQVMAAFTKASILDNRIINDGEVAFLPVTDGYRNGLEFLNKLYSEGLIYSEDFTTGVEDMWTLNETDPDVNTIGAAVGMHRHTTCNWGSERWRDYDYLGPLRGPDGFISTAQQPNQSIQLKVVFSASCKNPEATMMLNDYVASEEGGWLVRRGIKGYDYVDADPGELDLFGNPAVFRYTTPEERGDDYKTGSLNIVWPVFLTPEMDGEPVVPGNEPGDYWGYYHGAGYLGPLFESVMLPADNFWPSIMYYSSENLNRLSLLQTDIDNHVGLAEAEFIMGVRNIDRDWETFKNELDSMGLQEYLQLSQKEYDANTK